MRIACVAYLHGAGGAERQIILLANELARQGDEVSLIVLAEFQSKYEIREDVTVYDLTACENKRGNRILHRYVALKEAYRKIMPQVTIHFWLQSAYLSAFMSRSISGDVIYSERGDPADGEYAGMLGIVRAVAFRKVKGIVFQSEGAKQYFSKSIQNKSVVIPNPISVPEDQFLTPCMNRKRKIVNVGRLHPQKNQALLIDAFSLLHQKRKDYVLEIYGEGILREELTEKIRSLGLEEYVILKGNTEHIFEEIHDASLFVLSSDYEGMPNALMEAMALGVPCVSTDCRPGGARALIRDGENGFIVPTGDAKALAEAMERALTLQDMDKLLEAAWQIRVTHHGKVIFDKWKQFLHGSLNG